LIRQSEKISNRILWAVIDGVIGNAHNPSIVAENNAVLNIGFRLDQVRETLSCEGFVMKALILKNFRRFAFSDNDIIVGRVDFELHIHLHFLLFQRQHYLLIGFVFTQIPGHVAAAETAPLLGGVRGLDHVSRYDSRFRAFRELKFDRDS
jgi:hypothetical protein